MATKLYPYQQEGVEMIEATGIRAYLADSMGLGKTIQALTVAKRYLKRDGSRPVVIVCPASLKWNWEREAKKHLGMRIDVLESTSPPTHKGFKTPKVVVVNYDVLNGRQLLNGLKTKGWLNWLLALKPGLLIVDEAHYCKSRTAGRTKAVKRLAKACKHMIAISGTPLTNRPAELWPVLNMLWPKKYRFFRPFAFAYCGPRRTPYGIDFSGATNLKRLHRRLKKHGMVRRLKKDVLKDLPPTVRTVVPLKLEPADQKLYDEAETDTVSWLKKYYSDASARKAMKAEALQKVGHLKRLAAYLKIKPALKWLKELRENTKEKVLMFGIHKRVVRKLKAQFPGCAYVTGEVTGNKRQEQFDRFNADKGCREFIGNLIAAGTGWSANACSTVIKFEFDWQPGNHTQAEARIDGINRGQKGVTGQMIYLAAMGTIDERLCLKLQQKQDTLDKVLDGRVHEGLNLFDQVVDEMMGKAP